jgi:hypothetical protein
MRDGPTKEDLLFLDVDCRLAWLWREAWDIGCWDLEWAARYFRYAYGQGYWDALREYRRGQLYRDHRIPIPKREPKPSGPRPRSL